ncbi:alpha/beta hydrolase [Kitasatospora sp. NPDC059408]|uniref:alpha/beta hydrolase n=1 Tax=Kitasatospora sp. NPDC059408 TaxID=3346823 RepID=UPI0036B202B3
MQHLAHGGRGPRSAAVPRRVVAALALLGTAALAGCVGPAVPPAPPAAAAATPATTEPAVRPDLAGHYGQQARWSPCGDGLQCAALTVPLDYAQPGSGQTFTLPLVKHPADDPARRIGSLVFNPGGPGGSGVETLKSGGLDSFGKQARTRFDIVGFDPRGVAGSKPALDCTPPDEPANPGPTASGTPAPLYPRTPAERAAALADADREAAACKARSAGILPHVGTLDAARDLDVLRAVLGDDKLTYLGWSYGTYLGTVYGEQFPHRVRAMVLDGAIDPSLDWAGLALRQAKGFQRAVDGYADRCAAVVGQACPAGTPDGIRALITDLYETTARGSGPTTGPGRRLDQNTLHTAITTSMYSPESQWQPLSEALGAARRGNAAKLTALAEPDPGHHDDGPETGGGQAPDNSDAALTAVNCLDTPYPADPQAYWDLLDRAHREAGVFGAGSVLSTLTCRTWPAGPLKPHRVTPAGLPPVLVVGTTGDPATTYEEAQALAAQLPGGMLLTYRGPGHTAYGRGNACVTDAVDAYLVGLVPVRAGGSC